MDGYGSFEDQRIKHLEMIQAVIGRLGNDSFLVKGWAITVSGVFFGFAINSEDWKLAIASVLPTVMFWGLDAYFLRCERLFRALYERVRTNPTAVTPFYMSATSADFVQGVEGRLSSWWATLWRPTLSVFYGVLLISAIGVAFAICAD